MSVIIEESFLINSIGETMKGSLHILNQSVLERSYTLEASEGLIIQLFSDWIKLMRDITKESDDQKVSRDLDFKNQRQFLTKIYKIVIDFFDRYSEFGGQDFQEKFMTFKAQFNALMNLIEGIEEINASESKSGATEFLKQLDSGTDLVVNVIETQSASLPINILSGMKVIFIQLPVKVREILEIYSPIEEQDQKEVRKYIRQIDRAFSSGVLKINDAVSVRLNHMQIKSEEDQLQAQIERNFAPMQLVEFWLREDQQRTLTKDEELETHLLMTLIDTHRDRQLFN
jgi:hypothetical protein